jgi:hypothetical protein
VDAVREERAAATRRQTQDATAANHWKTAIEAIEALADDEPLKGQLKEAFGKGEQAVRDLYEGPLHGSYADAFAALLPADKQPDYRKAIGKDTTVAQRAKNAAEFVAPFTNAWKVREAEHVAALAAAKDEGFKLAGGVEGQPSMQSANGKNADLTLADLARMDGEAIKALPDDVFLKAAGIA